MDKKNTMLLTVIAVATLLVAVVGATFAFFALEPSATNTNVSVGATTPVAPGTVTLTGMASEGNATPLYLNVTVDQMAQSAQNNKYYAMTSQVTPATSPQLHTLATIEADGDNNAKYDCDYKFTVTATGVDGLAAADGALVLTAGTGVTLSTNNVALNAINNTEITADISIADGGETTIKGDIYIENTSSQQNTTLNNKNITITVVGSGFSCTQVAA